MDANNIDRKLRQQLEEVALRYRRVRGATALAIVWILLATVGAILLSLNRAVGFYIQGEITGLLTIGGIATLLICVLAWRVARDPLWVARRIEQKYPQLEARLLTAIEQRPRTSDGRYDYLQYQVIQEALFHGYRYDWRNTLPKSTYAIAHLACLTACVAFSMAIAGLYRYVEPQPFSLAPLLGLAPNTEQPSPTRLVNVDPGSTSIERGTSLLVLAKFDGQLPLECTLVASDPTGTLVRQIPMVQSLNDPVFGGRVPTIDAELMYHVLFAEQQSDEYQVTVFEYPALQTADAVLVFPEYTATATKTVQDVRHITAVEGTTLTLLCHLNKPVVKAVLRAEDGTQQEMNETSDDPTTRTATFTLTESLRMTLLLEDDAGRNNKQPPEFVITVTPNRRATLELAFPSRDVEVSPIEELQLTARLWDDYGLRRFGVSYQFGEGDIQEVTLGESATTPEKLEVNHTLDFEQLKAQPNQLLSYHFWAEDVVASGEARRTMSDMFFAEVRPFDEIYRQGQQPPGDEAQQQQPQQQQGDQSGAGNQTEQLAQQQKEVITATWNVLRREDEQQLSPAFAEDVAVVRDAQVATGTAVEELAQQIDDAEAQQHVQTLMTHLNRAVAELTQATDDKLLAPLHKALQAEQAVYQSLLNLRAREHEVVRSQVQNAQQARSSASSSNNRSQQQLQQLALSNNENRYETERQAEEQQQRNAAQEAARQTLNRLRELARRQNDLNKRLQELQSELEQATDEQEREELLRQLKRLREQQQDILRDTDELNSQMNQSGDPQDQADAQQRLQQARENVRRASEALEEGRLSQAISSGTRAQRELDELRDEFRQQTSEQFTEEARELQRQANALADAQRELAEKLNKTSDEQPAQQRSLRDPSPREDVLEQLEQQNRRLDDLLDRVQETVREAEEPQPLLAEQLYDSFREARQNRVQETLQETQRSMQRGFVDDARQLESSARQGIERLRDSIEQAAESVLGDETGALQRARQELDELARELNEEIQQADPQSGERQQQGDAQQQGDQQRDPQQGDPQQGDPQQSREGGQPGQGAPRSESNPQQPGEGQPPSQEQQPAGQSGGGEPGQQQRDREGQPQDQSQQPGPNQPSEPNQQPGNGQPGQGGGDRPQGTRPRDPDAAPRLRGPNEGQPNEGQPSEGQPSEDASPDAANRTVDGLGGAPSRGGNEEYRRPLTGSDFRRWADRLQNVEEMIGDPDLRSDAARIRDRAKEVRSDLVRHSQEPNWEIVRKTIAEPLNELRERIGEELQKRVSKKALVPIDRDPVPIPYQEQVRRYYERIGSGE